MSDTSSFLSPIRKIVSLDTLHDHLAGRLNNFTVIRFVLATMVLYAHSFALAGAGPRKGFLSHGFYGNNIYMGSFAVNCFFFLSGLLITQSYCRRKNFPDFIWARVQRIYPGNTVCLLLCILILGPIFTTLPIGHYLTDPKTYKHFVMNLFLFNLDWYLPGVFDSHKNGAINGSLWTLPMELRCYLAVGFIGVLGGFRNKLTANITLPVVLGIGLFAWKAVPFIGDVSGGKLLPVVFFLVGALCFTNARYIFLSPAVLAVLIAACFIFFRKPGYDVLFPITGCYALLILAYRAPYLKWNEWGDFSYGMYIYAFPCQQIWSELFPKWNAYENSLAAFVTTFILAVASWFYVEKKAIAWRRRPEEIPIATNIRTSS